GGKRGKLERGGDNGMNGNRKGAAGKRRRLLRDQLRDLCLLIHREKVGLRGGGLGRRLRRGCRHEKAQACRERQNLSPASLLRVASVAIQLARPSFVPRPLHRGPQEPPLAPYTFVTSSRGPRPLARRRGSERQAT